MNPQKLKEETEVELICPDCNLPIAGDRPRSDITRYLSESSRCQCRHSGESSADSNGDGEGKKSASQATRALSVKVGFSLEDASEVLGERFEVLGFLGQGGMGSVFRVKENKTGQIFAVKLLNPQLVHDEHSVKRFEQEAKAAMHLTHAHLAAVYEYGMGKDDTPYLVMDYLEGTTLEQLLSKENYLDSGRGINLFIQICEAMSYAHLKGVIHRDIKPSNIMVTKPSEGPEYAKLFDFGIAKVLPNQAVDFTTDMTQTGDLYGSPLYMSPEQCQGGALDERTDIYSLGCVMYKTLSGRHPFEGKNFVDTVVKIVTQNAESLSSFPQSKLPRGLESVVLRCLSKDTKYRYKNAALLQEDLERVRDGKPISKIPEQAAEQKAQFRRVRLVGLGAALLGLSIATLAVINPFFVPPKTDVQNPPGVSGGIRDAHRDSEDFDNKSYYYFSRGEYAKAIPLLQFGLEVYKDNDSYRADNYNHLGKCFLMLKQYDRAVPFYQNALRLYQQWDGRRTMMPEAIKDYGEVLKQLGRAAEAKAMQDEFARLHNLKNIP